MDTQLRDLRPYDLRQAAYCRRKVYFLHVAVLPQRETWSMQAGSQAHADDAVLCGKRALEEHGLMHWQRLEAADVRAPLLGLSGKIDVLFSDGHDFIPLEYKAFGSKPRPGDVLQLTAYALMLEEMSGRPVPWGLWVGEERLRASRVDFTPAARRRVIEGVADLQRLVASENYPDPPVKTAVCRACEFLNFCGDVD